MGTHETLDGGPLPIDLEHLSQYTADDPAITRDVLGLFREQVPQWVEDLKSADDLEAWKAMAHKMKGGARGVGAEELADLALLAESLETMDGADRLELLARVEHAAGRVTRYATQLLEDSPFVG